MYIKPRYDDSGVPWCDAGCPQCNNYTKAGYQFEEVECCIDKQWRLVDEKAEGNICPHAVKRMAVEIEAWRSGRLRRRCVEYLKDPVIVYALGMEKTYNDGRISIWEDEFDTADSAVDALLGEE